MGNKVLGKKKKKEIKFLEADRENNLYWNKNLIIYASSITIPHKLSLWKLPTIFKTLIYILIN